MSRIQYTNTRVSTIICKAMNCIQPNFTATRCQYLLLWVALVF